MVSAAKGMIIVLGAASLVSEAIRPLDKPRPQAGRASRRTPHDEQGRAAGPA
jgi:hypothetical protein